MKFLPLISGVMAGACLMAISLRKKMPLIGTLLSPKLRGRLDATDTRLAVAALFFFTLCVLFIVVL